MRQRRNQGRKNFARKPRVSRQLQTRRQLAGTKPLSMIDRIAGGVGTVATIAKTVSGLMNLVNVEDHYIDTALTAAVTNAAAGTAINVNLVGQGTDRNQRVGNKLLCKAIHGIFAATIDSAIVNSFCLMRFVLVLDKKPQIGPTTWTSVYLPSSNVGLINKDSAGDRYVILKDKLINLDTEEKRSVFFKFFINLERIHNQYFDNINTSFETGRITLLMIHGTPALTVNTAGIARFQYLDN